MTAKVCLALGSNVGESRQEIAQAIELLREKLSNLQLAPLYTSRAVGYTEQPDFLNTAVMADTALEPMELLKFVKDIEARVGRVVRFRWGPREIDIDIIFYGDLQLDTPALTIPHPRFAERDFVLKPICDLVPDFVDPRSGKTVQELYDQLPPDELAIIG